MIRVINKSELLPLMDIAKLSGLVFNNSTHLYFGFFKDGVLVGFCGAMLMKNKAVLKNGFVIKQERCKGIYRQLNEHRLNYLRALGIKTIEGNMTDKSLPLHLKAGASIIKKFKICTKIQYQWQEQ